LQIEGDKKSTNSFAIRLAQTSINCKILGL